MSHYYCWRDPKKVYAKDRQKKQQQQIKDTAKATIMIKKIRETQKKHKT